MESTINPKTTQVNIRLFGAFRQFSDQDSLSVNVPTDCRAADLRRAFAGHFDGNSNALALLDASAFATDEAILDDEDRVPVDRELSILPPVCGG